MIHAAAAASRRADPPIRKIVFLGITLSQIPLWYTFGTTRFVVLWLVALGLSAVCAWLVPPPRRWLVGLGSLVSFLSVLTVNVRAQVLWSGDGAKVWFVLVPLLGVILLHIYLMLSKRAVPLPDTSPFAHEASLPNPRVALHWRRFLTLLIAIHALGVGLYWAYADHACSRFDLLRRVQGCALVRTLPTFPAHTNEVQLSPSGALAASVAPVTYTESLLLGSPLTDEKIEALRQQIRTESSIISLWDLKTGRLWRTLEIPARPYDVTFSPNDQLVAARDIDDQTRIWSVGNGRLQHTIPDAGLIAFSADGSLLAATKNDDTSVRLWSMQDGTLLRTINLAEDVSFGVEMLFSPDGSLLAMRDGSELTLWRVADGTLQQTIDTDQYYDVSRSLSFSPDGQILATTGRWFRQGDGGAVLLWRVADGTLLHGLKVNQIITEEPYSASIGTAAFSPDGTRVAVDARAWPQPAKILVWRVADGALLEYIDRAVATDLITFNDDGTALQLYGSSWDPVRIYNQRLTQAAAQ
ncbi:MAG TPA: hypothetical protein VGD58_06535 [Herpetosiphonaceae bacterium]